MTFQAPSSSSPPSWAWLRSVLGTFSIATGAVGVVLLSAHAVLKGVGTLLLTAVSGSVVLIFAGFALLYSPALGGPAFPRLSLSARLTVGSVAAVVAFGIGELAVRVGPYAPIVISVEAMEEAYRGSTTSYLIHDPMLGWAPRPGSRSENGLYMANSAGIRSDVEHDPAPNPGRLRIAVFGDSFTHGDEVPLADTWPYQLERILRQEGLDAEVLNFGVGGYGMDQAYLRWLHHGRDFHPHVIIFGFQPENVLRNLNVVRYFYDRGFTLPFTKPRFVLEGDRLRLVNSPTLPPEGIRTTLEGFERSPLAAHESFFDPEARFPIDSPSRFVVLLHSALVRRPRSARDHAAFFSSGTEGARLALAIVDEFSTSASAEGARFLVAYLPLREHLDEHAEEGRPLHADLLDRLAERTDFINTVPAFDLSALDGYFMQGRAGGHYTDSGNEAVARRIASRLLGVSEPEAGP
jgi:hypothetical protein